MPGVSIVGSINRDLTVFTQRHPGPGETVLGSGHYSGGGGKGANQAIAAARLGASVYMVGRVGDDESGSQMRSRLAAEGVDTTHVGVDPEEPTGLAFITVDGSGENSIVVSPGANSALTPGHVAAAADDIAESAVCLASLEVPLESVVAAARAVEGVFVLNPAPAAELPPELVEGTGIVVPNRSELTAMSGVANLRSTSDVVHAARSVDGFDRWVVTLGSAGAIVIDRGTVEHVESPDVVAVDTTGCGDAFCAALAVALEEDRTLVDSARWAGVAGAIAATRRGAQGSMPTRDEVQALAGF